jgi:NhaP-type Na+/H+ or K+/H+ antiporter
MLTSAPFDDWWHNAYGLDVRIISPPHVLLLVGMMGIVLGALLRTLTLQNRADDRARRGAAVLFSVSSGLFLTILAILLMEWSDKRMMHGGGFYRALSVGVPFLLVAVAVAGRSRWSATIAALVYMLTLAGTSWALMLFEATPKLGPIYQHITHYVPLDFPLLLVFPALALDLTWQRVQRWPGWRAALALGAVFLVTLVAVQWPFANLLVEHGRNWFLHADNLVYWYPRGSEHWNYQFHEARPGEPAPWRHAVVALLYAALSSLAGLSWGRWMTRVTR